VLDSKSYQEVEININELSIETTRGSGKGGQHKNTTDSCVIITHTPTGIKVVRDGRDQHRNKEDALEEIKKRVNCFYKTGHEVEVIEERNSQIGNGERSDKKRTYREKDDKVIDHDTGKSASLKQFMKGKLELLSK
jgi:peptide chain release factor 1